MSVNLPSKITHYNPDRKNSPDIEAFMQRTRDGFYTVLTDEWIVLQDRQTTAYVINNGPHQLVHKLDARTFGLIMHFLQVTNGKVLTYWLKNKFETGDLAAIERVYGISFKRKD